MMYDIAVIGAGEVGSRHLQALNSPSVPARISVVDPVAESRDLAKERWREADGDDESISCVSSIQNVESEKVDFAIIATTSAHRRAAFEELIGYLDVDYVLFEKILFQEIESYDRVGALLDEHGITAWVNCPRRLFQPYQQINENIRTGPIDVEVTGNSWGLGCNGIHFIDLFGWLTGTSEFEWDRSGLVNEIVESKREGFVEFSGRIEATDSTNNTLGLRCFDNKSSDLSVRISTPNQRWIVNETRGTIQHEFVDSKSNWQSESTPYEMVYQSNLTGSVAQNVLDIGHCGLTEYAESSSFHVPFVRALMEHFEMVKGEKIERCPIT